MNTVQMAQTAKLINPGVFNEVGSLFAKQRLARHKYLTDQCSRMEYTDAVVDYKFGAAELIEDYVKGLYIDPKGGADHLHLLHGLLREALEVQAKDVSELKLALYEETVEYVMEVFRGSIDTTDITWLLRINALVGGVEDEM